MNRRYLIILVMVSCLPYIGVAQDNVVNESFLIKKERHLTLPIAERSFFSGYLPDTKSENPTDIRFDSVSFERPVVVALPAVKSSLVNPPKTQSNFSRHLVKIGGGNLLHSRLHYQYLSPVVRNGSFKINLSHEGYGKGPVRGAMSEEDMQGLMLQAKKTGKNSTIDWNLNGGRHHFYYYGISDSLVERQAIPSNTKMELSNRLRFMTNKGPFYSSISLGHYFTGFDAFLAKENHVNGMVDMSYRFTNLAVIRQNVGWDYLDYQSLASTRRSLFTSKTYVTYRQDSWDVSAGINLIKLDSLSDEDHQLYMLPDVMIDYHITDNQALSIGVRSERDNQSLAGLTSKNSYLSDSISIRTGLNKNKWEINYQVDIKNKHHFSVGLSYATLVNKVFFVNNTATSLGQFDIRYDDTQIGRLAFTADAKGTVLNELRYQLSADLQQFYLDTLSKSYHEPTLKTAGQITYDLSNQLSFTGTINWWYKMNYFSNDNNGENEDSIIDLGLVTKWTVSQKITAFTEISNLLNQSNSRYYLYRSRPVLVKAGVFLSF